MEYVDDKKEQHSLNKLLPSAPTLFIKEIANTIQSIQIRGGSRRLGSINDCIRSDRTNHWQTKRTEDTVRKNRRILVDKKIAQEIEGDSIGDEFKGYIFRITGGNDKQGFPMKQGVLLPRRVLLLLARR